MSNFKEDQSFKFKFEALEREVVSVLIDSDEVQKIESKILDNIIMESKKWLNLEKIETIGYYLKLSEMLKEIEEKDNETKLHGIKKFHILVQERELKRISLANSYKQNYLNLLQKLNSET
ncbi:15802_t:CDS:1 [Racocetra fulgida]|uniref:15802_t:CDS:1 n=1 Tax=Racocetra fulgida TaxID=60492 RepID=A0A9N9AAQ4_9GLOM|nr:15802_t:CDS:1 [Racocetra fulgida]